MPGDFFDELLVRLDNQKPTFKKQFLKRTLFFARVAVFITLMWVATELAQETASALPFALVFIAIGLGISLVNHHDDLPD